MTQGGDGNGLVVWGSDTLRDSPCRKSVIHDAIYIPMSSTVFFDRDPHWGVFDAFGQLLGDAAYTRMPERILVGQSDQIDLSAFDIAECPHEEMTYCGPIIPHYGHFVLTSLARLWALETGSLALFHSQPAVWDHCLPYMHQLLAAAGVSRHNAMSFDKPVRIRRLVIPEPSLREQSDVSVEYFDSCRSIGARLNGSETFGGARIYLSKSHLTGGVSGLDQEEVLDDAFGRAGFTIVFPETLTLADQVSLFREAEAVVGLAGSGFHTLALVPDTRCKVSIFVLDHVNSNFLLIDKGMHEKPSYHTIAGFINGTGAGRFDMTHRASDIAALAAFMVTVASKQGKDVTRAIPQSHDGTNYLEFLPQIVRSRCAETYLEVGVNTGDMLAKVHVKNAVGVDPAFRLNQNVTMHKKVLTLVQETSDVFFADENRMQALFPRGIDVSFLDGMHTFEFLLRDFIAAEAHASELGFIAMHDCLPVNGDMVHRDQAVAVARSQASGRNVGWWTGDVWKVVLILRRFRPDLAIHCINCDPTGLVIIEHLDPLSVVLKNAYDAIVTEFMASPNDHEALRSFYNTLPITKAEDFGL